MNCQGASYFQVILPHIQTGFGLNFPYLICSSSFTRCSLRYGRSSSALILSTLLTYLLDFTLRYAAFILSRAKISLNRLSAGKFAMTLLFSAIPTETDTTSVPQLPFSDSLHFEVLLLYILLSYIHLPTSPKVISSEIIYNPSSTMTSAYFSRQILFQP